MSLRLPRAASVSAAWLRSSCGGFLCVLVSQERVSGAINGDVARRLAKSMVLRFGERDKDKDKAGSGKKGATAAGGAGGAGAGAGSGKKAAAAAVCFSPGFMVKLRSLHWFLRVVQGDSSDDDMPAAPRSAGSAGGAGSASGKLERKAEPVEDFEYVSVARMTRVVCCRPHELACCCLQHFRGRWLQLRSRPGQLYAIRRVL